MSTILDVITRALRRSGILAIGETASADYAASALDILNEMTDAWKISGVDILKQGAYATTDTFQFFVPPVDLSGSVIPSLVYQSTWDASANSPALATSTGTKGYVYRVATAGSTTLDSVTSWSVNDYAVFDGSVWLKSRSSDQHRAGVIAMLALACCEEYGVQIQPTLARDAAAGWSSILAHFVVPFDATLDSALIYRQGATVWL